MRVINEDFTVFSNIVFDYFQDSQNPLSVEEYFKNENISLDKYGKLFIACYK